ncbi:AAA family ATPase [Phenylobacterium sp. J367]|uniref:AAA family ATPase n=1 Tax=Phenylobacterium sp. J367 TaxID=2898435 RepID=UPI002151314B|nr:AAA family ATPase [Phenylobacterium sp. J367]MCR5877925.1 AAA family ATPase [Phenylobacterium sp. J367]
MRVVVIGSSGSGKSTFARRLAQACDLAHVELDALNWGPDWTNRSADDAELFLRLVGEATAGPRWVTCGNYRAAMAANLPRATHLIWLDYPRPLVMARVIRRSFGRAAGRKELWPGTGNREDFRRWLDRDHPIRWAWDTYARRKLQYAALFADPRTGHLETHRLTRPREAQRLIAKLAADTLLTPPPPSAALPGEGRDPG